MILCRYGLLRSRSNNVATHPDDALNCLVATLAAVHTLSGANTEAFAHMHSSKISLLLKRSADRPHLLTALTALYNDVCTEGKPFGLEEIRLALDAYVKPSTTIPYHTIPYQYMRH